MISSARQPLSRPAAGFQEMTFPCESSMMIA